MFLPAADGSHVVTLDLNRRAGTTDFRLLNQAGQKVALYSPDSPVCMAAASEDGARIATCCADSSLDTYSTRDVFAHDAAGFDGSAQAGVRDGNGGSARVEIQTALCDFERELAVEVRCSCARRRRGCGRFGSLGTVPAAVPERPVDVQRDVPRVVPLVLPWKDSRVRACIVQAASDIQLWKGRGRRGSDACFGSLDPTLECLALDALITSFVE